MFITSFPAIELAKMEHLVRAESSRFLSILRLSELTCQSNQLVFALLGTKKRILLKQKSLSGCSN
jgi:hypothetical protein